MCPQTVPTARPLCTPRSRGGSRRPTLALGEQLSNLSAGDHPPAPGTVARIRDKAAGFLGALLQAPLQWAADGRRTAAQGASLALSLTAAPPRPPGPGSLRLGAPHRSDGRPAASPGQCPAPVPSQVPPWAGQSSHLLGRKDSERPRGRASSGTVLHDGAQCPTSTQEARTTSSRLLS